MAALLNFSVTTWLWIFAGAIGFVSWKAQRALERVARKGDDAFDGVFARLSKLEERLEKLEEDAENRIPKRKAQEWDSPY